ncbi:hypothetical protein DFH09DRAFT_1282527 [Mycena vulgaris]|nr:hypothetical protein DFH09DRAFT_1282527 [Mycena vulgaris]
MVHSAAACSPEEFLEVLQYPNHLCVCLSVKFGADRAQCQRAPGVAPAQPPPSVHRDDDGDLRLGFYPTRKLLRVKRARTSESEAATPSWRHARAVPSLRKLSPNTHSELLSIVFFLKSIQALFKPQLELMYALKETKTRQEVERGVETRERSVWEVNKIFPTTRTKEKITLTGPSPKCPIARGEISRELDNRYKRKHVKDWTAELEVIKVFVQRKNIAGRERGKCEAHRSRKGGAREKGAQKNK